MKSKRVHPPFRPYPFRLSLLAIPKLHRELGRVSNFNQSINHRHMKDHVESCYLTKFDAFRVNKDQVMDLETWFQIHTNDSNFEKASPQTILTLKIFYQFCENCKIVSFTYHLKRS